MYYHMKFIKNDFGVGIYDFKKNPYSSYYAKNLIFFYTMKLIPLINVLEETQMPWVSCADFCITRSIDYKREAINYLKKSWWKISMKIFLKELCIYFIISFLCKIKLINLFIYKVKNKFFK